MSEASKTKAAEDSELVAALLSSATIRCAAEVAGVSEATLYRRLRDPGFRGELKEQRLRVYSHSLQRLQVAAEDAVEVLEGAMRDGDAPLSARVKCAAHVLELAAKAQPEMVDYKLQDADERLLEDLGL